MKIKTVFEVLGGKYKMRTRLKKVKTPIVGKRFFDGGEYGLGYFTVTAAYKFKEFCKGATTPNGSHWFDKGMIVVKTDNWTKYKIPFIPWAKVYTEDGEKSFSDCFNEHPW